MRRAALLVTITLGALTGPLRAQAGPDTTWIARWRDSLAGLDDAALRARLSATSAPTTVEDRLRLGWLLETGGERLDSAPLLTRAADQFYEVTVRQKRWTAGWFGLGTAKAALADLGVREVRSAHQNPGTGWVWGSALAYLQVLAIDSTHGPAAVALARLTPRLDIGSRRSAAANAIGRAVRADSTDPMLWLLSARAARDAGASTAVLTALGHALALPNAPVGGLQFERAWELFTLDQREEAEAAYYLGAGMDDSLGRALYRQDLAYVADSTELRAWDRTAAAARGAWLQAFWERREREAGRPAGSRLREHRRRLRYAREHFAVIPTWSREYNFETINHEEVADLDDRGVIYVRHGEPDVTTGLIGSGGGLPLNASWMYYRTEGNLIFHFIAVRGRWALIPSLAMLSPPDNPSPEVFASRMALDPWYGVIALRLERDSTLRATNLKLGRQVYDPQTGAFDILRLTERDRRARTADIRRGLSTDSDPLHFERAMEPIVQVFGASAETPGQGRLVVAFSLPANDRLVPVPLPDGATGYLLRLRVTSADDSGRTTLDSDTLLRVRTPHPLTRGEHLSVVRSFLLPATGDQRVRLILTDTARAFGAVRIVNGVPLPSTDVERPEMTDLIVGATRSGVAWARPGSVPVPLHPLNAWTTDEAIEINFELTGVAAGARYTVRIGIADLGADSTAPPRASVQFENQASGVREFVSQSLVLRTLRPGRYLLTATVMIGDTVLRREKRITVVQAR